MLISYDRVQLLGMGHTGFAIMLHLELLRLASLFAGCVQAAQLAPPVRGHRLERHWMTRVRLTIEGV